MKVPESWTFEDAEVAQAFESHVREQLPWYDTVTAAIAQIANHYVPEGGTVYDLGSGTGNVGRALAPMLEARGAQLCSLEPSSQMAWLHSAPGPVIEQKAEDHSYTYFDFAVSMLTLMFVPVRARTMLLDRLLSHAMPGGALVFVERVLPPAGYPGIVTSRMTLAAKKAAGAPADEIVAKELSLAGVQRPVDARLFLERGAVEWFRFGDFAGYLIEGSS